MGVSFAVTFPGFGGIRESNSALGTYARGLGNKQNFGELERKGTEEQMLHCN